MKREKLGGITTQPDSRLNLALRHDRAKDDFSSIPTVERIHEIVKAVGAKIGIDDRQTISEATKALEEYPRTGTPLFLASLLEYAFGVQLSMNYEVLGDDHSVRPKDTRVRDVQFYCAVRRVLLERKASSPTGAVGVLIYDERGCNGIFDPETGRKAYERGRSLVYAAIDELRPEEGPSYNVEVVIDKAGVSPEKASKLVERGTEMMSRHGSAVAPRDVLNIVSNELAPLLAK